MSEELRPQEEPAISNDGGAVNDMEAPSKDSRMWAMLCHISGLAGFVIPFGNIVGPLVMWMIKKDESAFINDQGKEALNFQIAFSIYLVAGAFLILIAIGLIVLPIVAIGGLVLMIVAGVQANEGKAYRYPAIFRLIT
jgi:uncharacterized Tic20 family protein